MREHASPRFLLLDPGDVPPEWRERAVPMLLVPLLPEEAEGVVRGTGAEPALDSADERLAQLTAAGMPPRRVAEELGVTDRSVYRRLARLRRRLGVDTTTELVAELARRGMGRASQS